MREGLVPLALGLILASGLSMMRVADHNTLTTIISLATAAFVILSRRNPLWAIVAGAAASVAALQFG